MFHFSTYHPSSLKDLSYLSANFWMPDAKNCCPCHWRTTDCTSVYDTNFCPPSIFTPNVNCLLCKALVAPCYFRLLLVPSNCASVSISTFCVKFWKWLKFNFCYNHSKFAQNWLAINFISFICTRMSFIPKSQIFLIVSL